MRPHVRRLPPALCGCLVAFLLGSDVPSEAEPVCELTLAEGVELRSDDAPVTPSMIPEVARLSDGRFIVSHTGGGSPTFLEYTSDGELAGVHGRGGEGPGELSGPPHLHVEPGDTLVLFDSQLGRLTRLSPELSLLETRRSEFSLTGRAVFLEGSRVVRGGGIPAPGTGRQASPVIAPDGTILRLVEERNDSEGLVVARAWPTGFWALRPGGQEVRRYDVGGELLGTVVLDRHWFQSWSIRESDEFERTAEPRAENQAVQEWPGEDRLLVLAWVSEPDPPEREPGAGPVINPTTLDLSASWNSVVELFDPETGETLGSIRNDNALRAVKGEPRMLFSTRLSEPAGHVVIQTWELEANCEV